MRRKDREVTDFDAIVGIIEQCDILRIGLADGEYPYIVPLNFAYTVSGTHIDLYVHGAKAGRKYELMRKNGRCSFEMDIPLRMECITDKKDVTMRYKCVMGTADITFLEGEEKQSAIDGILMARYEQTRDFDYNRSIVAATAVARLSVTSITAKVNSESGGAE